MIRVPCTNFIIVLFILSVPNSHVTFLFYISIRAYIISSLLIMPPPDREEVVKRGLQRGRKLKREAENRAPSLCVYEGGERACSTSSPYEGLPPWKNRKQKRTTTQSMWCSNFGKQKVKGLLWEIFQIHSVLLRLGDFEVLMSTKEINKMEKCMI